MVWVCARLMGGAARARCLGLSAWRARNAHPGSWATVGVVRGMGSTEHIVSSSVPDIPLPAGNVASYVLELAGRWPTRTALECAVTGRSYTYAQVVDAVARWGGQVGALGLRRGDTLAVMMLNCPEYPLLVMGAVSVGVSVTVINSSYAPEEVRRQLEDSGASLVVHDDTTGKVLQAAITLLKKPVTRIINTDSSAPAGVPSLRSLLQDSAAPLADPVEVSETERALLPYSSGTSGMPKGVGLSHSALVSNVAMFTHPSSLTLKLTTEAHQDTALCYLPLFHAYGLVPIMAVGLRCGVKIVTVPKFDASAFVPLISKHKVRVLHLVPPVLNFLIESPAVTPESMASVDCALCGAAPVSQTAAQALKEKVDKPLFFQEGYGMTEVLITHMTPKSSTRLGSCGRPLPNVKIKVIDEDTGKALPANQKGEILVMTPSRMTGYINNEAATRETIDADGWVHSGDLGYYDAERFFTIVDRTKDLIKVKALQRASLYNTGSACKPLQHVSPFVLRHMSRDVPALVGDHGRSYSTFPSHMPVAPSELEEVILQHPKVKEVGVVGVPHDRLGEAPRAYVVTSAPATEKEIQEFVASRMAPHKQLVGGVSFISELPKNAAGKILKRLLRKLN